MPLPDKSTLLARAIPHRAKWDRTFRPPDLEPVGAHQESVWDYPRPPVLVPAPAAIQVMLGDVVIAESEAALEVKETAGAPVPYIPPAEVRTEWFEANGRVSVCEWKGAAVSYDLALPSGERIADAAWAYPDPFDDLAAGYAAIADWFAFYPARLECYMGDERVRPQPGGFYGGWVTNRIRGPVKGAPGTQSW